MELILVIAIIGIVTAVAVPTFSSWRGESAANNATKSLLSHMKQARVVSMAENRSIRITFAADSYTYDADTTEDNSCGLCKPQIVAFSNFSSNLKITKNDQAQVANTQTFSSRGTTASTTIYLCTQGFSKRIVVNIIGRAYLCGPGDTSASCTRAYTCS